MSPDEQTRSQAPVDPLPHGFRSADLSDVEHRVMRESLRSRLFGHKRSSPERVGRYVIESKIGEGGMGVVFRARDDVLERPVALKLLSEFVESDRRERIFGEARALAKLNHPHVVQVYDVGEHEGRIYVAMAYIEGQTLRAWLKGKTAGAHPLSWREILEVYVQAGQGLAAAHAAGLIHRDFKPENTLIGSDGRVRVVDFGLAQLQTAERVSEEPQPHVRARAGTPSYMSPEQFCGETLSPRSDQFSFCVALYEALYDVRPFNGETWAELMHNVTNKPPAQAPEGVRVPSWLHQAVVRGLSRHPDSRWPSMRSLLVELTRGPTRSRNRVLVAGGVFATLTLIAATDYVSRAAASAPCQGMRAQVKQVWSATRAHELTTAFDATGLEFAGDTATAVIRRLDDYTARIEQIGVDACNARADGRLSETLHDLRVACLERRLDGVVALYEELSTADVGVAVRAVEAVERLESLDFCEDSTRLLTQHGRLARPPDETAHAALKATRTRLRRVKSAMDAGRYGDALADVVALDQETKEVTYQPLRAEVLYWLASAYRESADYVNAEKTARGAFFAAEAGHHDRIAVSAATSLLSLVGRERNRADEAMFWWSLGEAKLRGDTDTRGVRMANLLNNLASAQETSDEHTAARDGYMRALELYQQQYGEEHVAVAETLSNLGSATAKIGDWAEAERLQQHSLEILERVLGPTHPRLSYPLNSLGELKRERGLSAEALPFYKRARVLLEYADMTENDQYALIINNLGAASRDLGRLEDAHELYRTAVATLERVVPANHTSLAGARMNLGEILYLRGRAREALLEYERARGVLITELGSEHGMVGAVLTNIGSARTALADYDAAERALTQASEIFADAPRELAFVHTALGVLAVERGQYPRAREWLERALDVRRGSHTTPLDMAETKFALARALIGAGRSPEGDERARRLAVEALAVFATVPERSEATQICAWLTGATNAFAAPAVCAGLNRSDGDSRPSDRG